MELLTREQILGTEDLQTERVEVPEWNGYVFVRALTGTERDKFEAGMVEVRGKRRSVNLENLRARLLSLVVVDDRGNRLFADKDVVHLGAKSAAALDRLFAVARRLSALT